jgi:hypothetical protein
MKKLFLLLFLTSNLLCMGQNKDLVKEAKVIKFFGIDYSHAKVYGAAETPEQFKVAFNKINALFIIEAKKYDVGKRIKKEISEISLDAVNQLNPKINSSELMTTNKQYALDEQQIKQAIQSLPIEKEEGIGMIFVAELLNKADDRATYQTVFFNLESKEIIDVRPVNGKARGFGLRNFWAYSIYKSLDMLK